jgi:ATP synthase protein I
MADSDENNLDQRLNKALEREELATNKPLASDSLDMSGMAYGMRMAMEFIGGTLVGFGMGFGLDYWLGTSPLFILIFTLLGFGAGMLNIYRFVNKIDETIGVNRASYLTEAQQNATRDTDKNPSEPRHN